MILTVNIDTPVDSTSSETDIPDGEGFAYAPKVFMDPDFMATVPQTEMEGNNLEILQSNYIGEHCEKCVNKYNRCLCNVSDWNEDLMEVEPLKNPTNDQNSNKTNHAKQPKNLTLVSIRQPPPGCPEFRRSVINQSKSSNAQMNNESRINGQGNTKNETPLDRIIIRGIRSISTKEFEEM